MADVTAVTDVTIVDGTTRTQQASVSAAGHLLVDVANVSDTTITVDTELPAAAALADNASTPTAPATGAFPLLYDGSTWDLARSIESAGGTGANVDTGILAVGVGPGWDRKRDPSNLGTAANSASTFTVNGADMVTVYIGTSTTGTYAFEVTADDTNWVSVPRMFNAQTGAAVTNNFTPTSGDVYDIDLSGWRQFRLRTVTTLGATMAHKVAFHTGRGLPLAIEGPIAHDAVDTGNPLKVGARAVNAFPTAVANNDRANALADLWGRLLVSHIDPAQQKHANKNFTTTQTGSDVITPTSGKKPAITSVVIGTYGTTAGRIILWFGDNADTTFTQDTDQVLVAFSTAPSANSKPGLVYAPPVPVFCTTADRELHITTDAGVSLDVAIEYYEW